MDRHLFFNASLCIDRKLSRSENLQIVWQNSAHQLLLVSTGVRAKYMPFLRILYRLI